MKRINQDEQYQHAPALSHELRLVYGEKKFRDDVVIDGVRQIDKTIPLLARLFSSISNGVLNLRGWSVNKMPDFRQQVTLQTVENQDVVNGMVEGDQLGGLHNDNVEGILQKADLDSQYVSQLGDITEHVAPIISIGTTTAMQDDARATLDQIFKDQQAA